MPENQVHFAINPPYVRYFPLQNPSSKNKKKSSIEAALQFR